jgi:UDP-N-acetylmuramate--alanine ligase
MPRIVIAAGGTAGHVVPALAIADELRARGAEVSFVGTRERAEAVLVPAAGYEISYLSVTGLDRRRPDKAARAAMRSVSGTATALRLLRSLKPDAVLGAGGYVAGPVGLAAVMQRIPLVLSEADSHLGLSNRMLAPFARRVCLAFPIEGREGSRYVVTGRPVPRAVVEADRAAARERLGIAANARCVLVFGGSQGARSINLCALDAFAKPADTAEVNVIHVSGRRDHPELERRLEQLGRPAHYRLLEWVEGTLGDVLAASDVVVARAGGSVFEIAAAGRPAVLVPYPHATADHQAQNARWFEQAGAALVLPDGELDAQRLRAAVTELLANGERLARMSASARELARPDAAARVADELLSAAGAAARADDKPWGSRRLHFVGIGGAGMSGLALVARELGAEVSGCDRGESVYTRRLRDAGIEPLIGHSAEHLMDEMEVVVSTAIPADSPELMRARERGLPIIHRGELLGQVAALRRLIAVSGTHGKTTTAAMTAHVLRECGADPTFVIGADMGGGADGPANAGWGGGEWIVAEADESDRSFLELSPEIAVVTNVELDHHTTYSSLIELQNAFRSWIERVPANGAAIVWNQPQLRALADGRRTITYDVEDGESTAPDLEARALRAAGLGTSFELARAGRAVCDVELPVAGRHNVLNALAALAAAEVAGCDLQRAARALRTFRPAARRFEQRADARGVRVFDDYAHHPTEVAATLQAARGLEPERLIAVFQPHLYSRTLHLHRELGRELARADVVVVLDVYASREHPEGELAGVTGKLVADACADSAGGRPVWWLPTLEEAEAVLSNELAEGDLVVTLGAGDVDRLAERLGARLNGSAAAQEGAG